MYRRTTKPFKKNTSPQIRLRLPMIKNEIKCGVYNQNRVFVGTDEVKEGSEVVLILHIRGLKVLKTSYYCDCYVTQIKLFQEKESKFNIIKDYSILMKMMKKKIWMISLVKKYTNLLRMIKKKKKKRKS